MPRQYAETNTQILLLVTKETRDRLTALAKTKKRLEPAGMFSVNSLIRQAIAEYLEREEHKVAGSVAGPSST